MVVELGGREIAIQAARNFRALRSRGVTVRKTIDTIIATRCIASGYDLLHTDRDISHLLRISACASSHAKSSPAMRGSSCRICSNQASNSGAGRRPNTPRR